MGPLMVIVNMVHLEICPPSHSNKFRVFPKGFLVALLEEPPQGPPLFLPLVWLFVGSDI